MDNLTAAIPKQLSLAFASDLRVEAQLQVNNAEEFSKFADLMESVASSSLAFSYTKNDSTRGLRYLAQSLALAQIQLDRPIIELTRSAAGWAAWSEFYESCAWSSPFIECFANGDIIGPKAPWYSEQLIVGLFVFGPDIFYPQHAHPAPEIYYVLSGNPKFQVGADQPFISQPPGSIVLHRSNISHAIKTDNLPVCGVYAWRGDLSAPSWYRNNMMDNNEDKVYPPMKK
ncbi:MAG: hypothetical protein GVY17_10505 [Cyanobacteria bacterium]|nr:hypothetical protein [Cyanobacteria bacterium GSL.Bin21]